MPMPYTLKPAGRDIEAQKNASLVLAGIGRSHQNPLAKILAAPAFLKRLFAFAFAPDVSILVNPRP